MKRYEQVILLRYSKGWSIKDLARYYKITIREVKNIVGIRTKKNRKFKEKNTPRLSKEFFYTLKKPCVHCGESDPRCIDFHHVDPKKKLFNVTNGTDKDLVLQEIKKCVNLCANCHRLLHCGDEQVSLSVLSTYRKN